MTYPTFLGSWSDPQAEFLVTISRDEVIKGSVREQLLSRDAAPAVVIQGNRLEPLLMDQAAQLRDDLYRHHQQIQRPLQLPLMNRVFCYAFAKGAEYAYATAHGRIGISYDFADALRGAAGAEVSEEVAAGITVGMRRAYNVFCDFQDHVLVPPEHGFANSGRWLADVIACGFYWASQVGVVWYGQQFRETL